MYTAWLKPLIGHSGPYVTVYLDATRADDGSSSHLHRWQLLRKAAVESGAPEAAVNALDEAFVHPGEGGPGERGRVLVATGDGVHIDRTLDRAPAADWATVGPAPALMPAIEAADGDVDYVVAIIDRMGADFRHHHVGPVDQWSVDGGHDDIHAPKLGGLSGAAATARAEDSWERNADAVAAEIETIVRQRRPELVLLAGDPRAVSLVRGRLARPTARVTRDVGSGARADGERPLGPTIADVLGEHRRERRARVLDEYETQRARRGGAKPELADVVRALARGQVAELLLSRDVASVLGERTLWVADQPIAVAITPAELPKPEQARALRADLAVVRSALAQDAGLTVCDGSDVDLPDGVGVTVRWLDAPAKAN